MEPYSLDPTTQHPNTVKILDRFNAYRVPYTHINGQPVYAFLVVPEAMPTGRRPLMVRFHGGGFVEGEADASLRPFFLELVLKYNAAIIAPDYRLRPEHSLADSVADVRTFWCWVEEGNAARALAEAVPGAALDADDVLVVGESAGGYMVTQTALLGMMTRPARALIMQYPLLDFAATLALVTDERPGYTSELMLAQKVGYEVVERHLASLPPGHVCSRAKFSSRMDLNRAMVQHGRFADLSGENAYLDPMNSVETVGPLPPMLLYHSKEDEALPYQLTQKWETKFRALRPEVPLHVVYPETGEHVFDKNHTMTEPWLKEPLEFIARYWPAAP